MSKVVLTRREVVKGLLATGMFIAGGSLVGCSSGSSDTSSSSSSADSAGGVLKIGTGARYVNMGLDVSDYTTYAYFGISTLGIGETLFHLNENLEPQPWLAKSIKQVDDLTWTITLRDDVKYHNGNSMTGKTVKHCLDRTMEDFFLASESLSVDSITASGDYEVTIVTTAPTPGIESILSDTIFMIYDFEDGADYATESYYTGPFYVDNIETDVCKHCKSFADYWNGASTLDEIQWIACDDATSALEAGDVDLVQSIPLANLETFEKDSNFTVTSSLVPRGEQFWFNENRPGVNDVVVRTAISMCLDRESIVEDIYKGMAVESYGIYPDILSFGGTDKLNLTVDKYDPQGAADLLAANGWVKNSDGILEKDGAVLDLKCVCYSDSSLLAVGDMLTSELKDLGINLSVVSTTDTRTYEEADDFDMILITYGMCMIGNPYYWNNTMVYSTASSNTGHYNNPEVDALIDQLNVEADMDKRDDICFQIEQHMIDDCHWIVFAHKKLWTVYNNTVVAPYEQSSCQYYLADNTLALA
jgi:peptide/nickel transport system substrate-binding protein